MENVKMNYREEAMQYLKGIGKDFITEETTDTELLDLLETEQVNIQSRINLLKK